MNPTIPLPDETKLRGLLDGSLSESEQAEVLSLVAQYPEWQTALDRLAAGAQTWEAAARHLQQQPLVADAALRSAIAAVSPPTAASDQPQSSEADPRLSFLTPVDDARYLGSFGQYLVEQVVGRGGFGIVLKAFDPQLRRIVALKVLAPHLASHSAACLRFEREAKAAAAVVHDHVITIHSVGNQPLPHLVMQYVAGQSLQEKLDKAGPLGVKEVLRIGMQTAAGLAAAHKHGEVHRDIKPANILLENGIERVKITDFGLARAADDASMTQSGTVAGTPQYMSPEQARGETVDFRSDLFSLGSVLYAMCAGRPPFRATTTMGVLKRVCEEPPRPIREVNPEVPDWLAAIIDKLMAKRPADRFASAQEVADLLGRCLSHVQQPGPAPLPQVGPACRAEPAIESQVASPGPPGKSDGSADEEARLDRARRAVREPAIGLMITGILNWVMLAIVFIYLSRSLLEGMMGNDELRWLIPVIAVLGIGSGLIVMGGLKLLRLENRSLVTLAGIAALLIGPGYFIGLPIGIWALAVLQRREVKDAFAIVRRRHWPGVAGVPGEPMDEGEWCARCSTCGYIAPLHKWGGVRIGAASRGKRSVLWCPSCRWFRWMAIERFSAKVRMAAERPVEPLVGAPASSAGGNGVAILVLVLLVLLGLPVAICSGIALTGYWLLSSSSAPPNVAEAEIHQFLDSVGTLIVDCPDSRFSVRIRRIVASGDGSETTTISAQDVTTNQPQTVVAGEYEVTVLSDGFEVLHDRLVMKSEDSPVVYKVKPGGTLRFVAGANDRNLSLVLNHITGQTLWDWPNRQWFVLPEGVVHVELRRPTDDGSPWHILTANYFDIVAGQETVLRVSEKNVELVSAADEDDPDPAIQLLRQSLQAVEARHAAGQVTAQELIEAQLKLHEAEFLRADKLGRLAQALAIRQRIVALAEENVKICEAHYKAGRMLVSEVIEARLNVLKAQEKLREAEAKAAKAAGETPPTPPPASQIMRRLGEATTQTA